MLQGGHLTGGGGGGGSKAIWAMPIYGHNTFQGFRNPDLIIEGDIASPPHLNEKGPALNAFQKEKFSHQPFCRIP